MCSSDLLLSSFKPVNRAGWADVGAKYGNSYPNLMALIDVVLFLHPHSVECERGFSLMKKVKTDWRSSLNTDTLTSLTRVALQSADEKQFDPEPAIHRWQTIAKRTRRFFQPPYGPRATSTVQLHDVERDDDNDDEEQSD